MLYVYWKIRGTQRVKREIQKRKMLIEVLRYKNKLPYDHYKEVIRYYRDHLYEIDFELVESYLKNFPKKDFIQRALQDEVL